MNVRLPHLQIFQGNIAIVPDDLEIEVQRGLVDGTCQRLTSFGSIMRIVKDVLLIANSSPCGGDYICRFEFVQKVERTYSKFGFWVAHVCISSFVNSYDHKVVGL